MKKDTTGATERTRTSNMPSSQRDWVKKSEAETQLGKIPLTWKLSIYISQHQETQDTETSVNEN